MAQLKSGPRILFLDIETIPLTAFAWGLWDQNISLNQIKKDWKIVCWAAKWRGSDKIISNVLKDDDTDKKLIAPLWKLVDEADILVGHNLDGFDLPKINARFIANGFKPPTHCKTIDTLKIAKQRFAFTSNKQEYLAKHLGCKQLKSDHKEFPGFELWAEFMKGNKRAIREMQRYNEQDVATLETIYDKLMPWYKTTVNFNVYNTVDNSIKCHCGSTSFKKNGVVELASGVYQRYLCQKCRHETRDGINLLSKEKKKSLRK